MKKDRTITLTEGKLSRLVESGARGVLKRILKESSDETVSLTVDELRESEPSDSDSHMDQEGKEYLACLYEVMPDDYTFEFDGSGNMLRDSVGYKFIYQVVGIAGNHPDMVKTWSDAGLDLKKIGANKDAYTEMIVRYFEKCAENAIYQRGEDDELSNLDIYSGKGRMRGEDPDDYYDRHRESTRGDF